MSDLRADKKLVAFMPAEFLDALETFTPEDWDRFTTALDKCDKDTVAEMLGMSAEEAKIKFQNMKQEVIKSFH